MLALVALGLVGCAALPSIPYDPATAGDIKAIGLLTPGLPERADVTLQTTVGMSFGLVGALVDAGLKLNRQSRLQDVVVEKKFSMPQEFMAQLTVALAAQGFAVAQVPTSPIRQAFVADYPLGTDKVQAYLDVFGGYGYVAAGVGGAAPWRPWMLVKVRLISAKDGSVLMQDTVAYNPAGGSRSAVAISPVPTDRFADFDTLTAAPDDAVGGMRRAGEQTAQAIGALMKSR